MLSEAVERFALLGVEAHLPLQCAALPVGDLGHVDANLAVGHAIGPEVLAAVGLAQQLAPLGIVEGQPSGGLADDGLRLCGLHAYAVGVLLDVVLRLCAECLWHDDQAGLLLRQLGGRGCLHTDDAVADHLQPHHAGFATVGAYGHELT